MHPGKTNVAKDRAHWTKVILRRSANAVSLRRQTVWRERIKRNGAVSHPLNFVIGPVKAFWLRHGGISVILSNLLKLHRSVELSGTFLLIKVYCLIC